MTPEKVLQQLRAIRYAPTITSIAAAAGLSRVCIYDAIKSGRVSPEVADALGKVLQNVNQTAV